MLSEPWKRCSDNFVPNNHEALVANVMSGVISVSSSGIALILCIIAAVVWADKRTRRHFSRTSSRLLFLCVAIAVPAGLAYGATLLRYSQDHPAWCRFGMYMTVFFYNFLNLIQCAISVNLVLALKAPKVFERHNLEKYYILCSFALAALIATIPIIAGRYLWNDETQSCWIQDRPGIIGVWQAGILEVPLLLVTVLMALATIVVARHLRKEHRSGKDTGRLLNQLYEPAIEDGTSYALTADSRLTMRFSVREIAVRAPDSRSNPGQPGSADSVMSSSGFSARMLSLLQSPCSSNATPAMGHSRLLSSAFPANVKSKSQSLNDVTPTLLLQGSPLFRKVRIAKLPMTPNFGKDPQVEEARRLRNTLWRISFYPVIHLIIGLLGPIGSLLSTATNSSRQYQLGLYYFQFFGVAWIPLAYSLCVIFADLSFIEGTREWISLRRRGEDEDLELALGKNMHHWNEIQTKIMSDVNVRHVKADEWATMEDSVDTGEKPELRNSPVIKLRPAPIPEESDTASEEDTRSSTNTNNENYE